LRETIDAARREQRSMPDPITAGSLVAAALAAGSAEAGEAALSQAAKDAHAALKSAAARIFAANLARPTIPHQVSTVSRRADQGATVFRALSCR
jgi:hypothetical protein